MISITSHFDFDFRSFGKAIERFCADRSVDDLSKLAGVHRTTVFRAKRGDRVASDTILAIAWVLNIDPTVYMEASGFGPIAKMHPDQQELPF